MVQIFNIIQGQIQSFKVEKLYKLTVQIIWEYGTNR